MFVKICGITRIEDAQAACECGANALGFVFWPNSPRFIEPERARAIVDSLPPGVGAVGVFVNQSAREVNDVSRRAGLTAVQLHGDETPAYAADIVRPIIKSISLGDDSLSPGSWDADVIWLLDVYDPDRRGGTGKRVDWSAAAAAARERRVLLAGGLTPSNVADAVAQVQPFGIDVSSGVESAPGIKNRALLDALFGAIHAIDH